MYIAPNVVVKNKKGNAMGMVIKEVSEIIIVDENNNPVRRSKLVISDNGVDTEIILEGNGRVKVATTSAV